MKIARTYPQPDSPQPNIGPLERALALCKYTADIEPEQAKELANFPLLVAAFEAAERQGAQKFADKHGIHSGIVFPESIVPLMRGEQEVQVSMQPFTKDGL